MAAAVLPNRWIIKALGKPRSLFHLRDQNMLVVTLGRVPYPLLLLSSAQAHNPVLQHYAASFFIWFPNLEPEMPVHLILDCPITIWSQQPDPSAAAWWEFVSNSLDWLHIQTAVFVCWHIWKERCRCIFDQPTCSEAQLVEKIKHDILAVRLSFIWDGTVQGDEPLACE